ncbi:hypothetical protein ACF0H5_006185 [Mactra antiquata]
MSNLARLLLLCFTQYCFATFIEPEVYMNTAQLISSKGYPVEEHDVTTKDGYILNVQRIPYGKTTNPLGANRPVILLQHGLLSSSACWVENLANNSLGFMLADAGYDVWLGNSRGNTYGRRHVRLSPKSSEFWRFSWDEMAKYDLPATVDFILSSTGASQIFYVGHSQGCEIAFSELSQNRDLASKIKMFVALAPAVYLGEVTSPLRLVMPLIKSSRFLLDVFGTGEFLPTSGILSTISGAVCNIPGVPSAICDNILFAIAGYDEKQLNSSRVPVYVGQHPAGTSTQNIIHYAQSIQDKKFQKYDYGMLGNLVRYSQTHPPEIHPENVNVPVLLYSGTQDWLVTPTDVTKLVSKIPNLVKHKVIPEWQHLDFIWAMNAPDVCYNDMISMLNARV